MANVLNDLANDIYKSAEVVGRDLIGAIPSIMVNTGSEGAAVGQKVTSFTTQDPTVNTITPSMTIPEGNDQSVGIKQLELTKQRAVQIPWTGEDIKFVNAGAGFETIYGKQIQRAMKKIVNEAEADVTTELYKNASRAIGVAGTTPFASTFDLIAEGRQILVDNGQNVEDNETSLILNTTAGTKLRNLAQLQKANEAGGDALLRKGTLLDLQNIMIKESAGIVTHIKGTGASYQLSAAAVVGATTINVDTGSGTIVAGDIVTIGNHNYVAVTALSGGSFTIGAPGLREAVADNTTIALFNNYAANTMVRYDAAEFAMRAPANPIGGDAADDVITIQDPFSGLVFMISVYKGYHKAMIEVGAVWGQKTWNEDGIALVAG